MNWNTLRMPVLATTCGVVLLLLGKVVLVPDGGEQAIAQTLPTTVPLPNWELLRTAPLEVPEPAKTEQVAGTRYDYRRDGKTLTVEMRYLVNLDPELRNLLLKYGKAGTPVPFPETVQQDAQTGYFSLFADEKNAYLTSCINSRGTSTATADQFLQNRYAHDFRVERLLPVIIGQETLRDGRCLWTHMTMPLAEKSTDEAYRVLRESWANWYQWWQPRFPQP